MCPFKSMLSSISRFTQKTKTVKDGIKIIELKFGRLSLWKDVRNIFERKLFILYIPVLFYKNKKHHWYPAQVFQNIDDYISFLQNEAEKNGKQLTLWIDHSLGGGTETYSFIQFDKFKDTTFFVRLQYYPKFSSYVLTTNSDVKTVYATTNFDKIKKPLINGNFSEIVVNNLVGYGYDISKILSFVISAKKKNGMKVSFRGHDYHSICPSFNLIDCDDSYCGLSHKKGCEYCCKNLVLSSDHDENKVLKSCDDIVQWRQMWRNFFNEALDEMIVFSAAVKDLFVQAYPELDGKTVIIPHTIKFLPRVVIPEHKNINIGVLGNISIVKGSEIVREMCKKLPPDCSISVIGEFKSPPPQLKVLGRYKTDDLPHILERNMIDLIFIPSIWPETFSYTTSEAMEMGVPVACFNLGAPAERVREYSKGLILKSFDPQESLAEILDFVKRIRKER